MGSWFESLYALHSFTPAGGTSLSIALIWAISMRILKTWSHNVHDFKLLSNRMRGIGRAHNRAAYHTFETAYYRNKISPSPTQFVKISATERPSKNKAIISIETARHEGKSFFGIRVKRSVRIMFVNFISLTDYEHNTRAQNWGHISKTSSGWIVAVENTFRSRYTDIDHIRCRHKMLWE